MMGVIIQICVIVFLPALLIDLTRRFKALRFMGPILLAYLVGIILANLPFVSWDKYLSMSISEVAVPIAIPLVLMSTNLLKWLKLAKTTVLSFVLVMVAAIASSLLTVFLFKDSLDISWKVAGMLTGCYTGGTPNLIAVGMSLNVPGDTMVLINTSDMIWGGMYFLLLTSVVKKVYRRFLPKFVHTEDYTGGIDPFMQGVFSGGKRQGIRNIVLTVGISLVITGFTVGLSMLIFGTMSMVFILLVVSTLGVGLSFSSRMHKIRGTWHIGQYVILLFSIGLGGTVDLAEFFRASHTMVLYVGVMMFSAIIIHFVLCKIFKIDSDTALITSTAGIYGPAFIAPVANALDNQEVVVSGLITGLAGYAIGNYLGLMVAALTQWVI